MRIFCLFLATIFMILFATDLRAAAPATRPANQPSKQAVERAEILKANTATFSLRLVYTGQSDKPYYRLDLSVPEMDFKTERNAFHQHVQITEAEAKKIIDQLAADGFLDKALNLNASSAAWPAPPHEPYYTLIVKAGQNGNKAHYEQWLTFDGVLFDRLDGLRKSLDGDAAKALDTLLGRLSGERKAIDKPAAK